MRPLFLATGGDVRVAEFFMLEGSGYRLERTKDVDAPADLSRAVMTLASLEAKVTDLYLRPTSGDSDADEAISAAEAEALRTAVQRLISHAEALRAALKQPGA